MFHFNKDSNILSFSLMPLSTPKRKHLFVLFSQKSASRFSSKGTSSSDLLDRRKMRGHSAGYLVVCKLYDVGLAVVFFSLRAK